MLKSLSWWRKNKSCLLFGFGRWTCFCSFGLTLWSWPICGDIYIFTCHEHCRAEDSCYFNIIVFCCGAWMLHAYWMYLYQQIALLIYSLWMFVFSNLFVGDTFLKCVFTVKWWVICFYWFDLVILIFVFNLYWFQLYYLISFHFDAYFYLPCIRLLNS